MHPPSPAAVTEAIAAFDTNDVPVSTAVEHGVVDVDRAHVMRLRRAGTTEAGDSLLAHLKERGTRAPLLLEQAALAYAHAGEHGRALSTRLDALPQCPRYDSWLSALLLSRVAESLLALQRAGEALPLAERALRFQPLEPGPLLALAAVRAAAGDAAGAARARASLFDMGVGPAHLPGPPTATDRAAEPERVDWEQLEPLSDAEMGRYLVLFRTDVTLADTLTAGRRHLAAQARHGDWLASKTTCAFYRDGSPVVADAGRWLGLPQSFNSEYVATRALIDAVTARPGKQKAPKPADLGHRLAGVRAHAIREHAAAGGLVPRALLTDPIWDVARAAAIALPDDPVVIEARAAEQSISFAPRVFSAGDPSPHLVGHTLGCNDHVLRDGQRITYPQGDNGVKDELVPVIERADSGRSKCKVCKAAIAADELRLDIRSKLFPVEHAFAHLACAPQKKKFAQALALAAGRSRLVP